LCWPTLRTTMSNTIPTLNRRQGERHLLVQQAPQDLPAKSTPSSRTFERRKPDTPIYLGEIGGPYSNPGNRAGRLPKALCRAGIGEMMNAGISRLTWWIGFGNCNGQAGNDSTSLYGWQDFGAYNVFSTEARTRPARRRDLRTMSPTARPSSCSARWPFGQTALNATVTGDTTDVRAYAATTRRERIGAVQRQTRPQPAGPGDTQRKDCSSG